MHIWGFCSSTKDNSAPVLGRLFNRKVSSRNEAVVETVATSHLPADGFLSALLPRKCVYGKACLVTCPFFCFSASTTHTRTPLTNPGICCRCCFARKRVESFFCGPDLGHAGKLSSVGKIFSFVRPLRRFVFWETVPDTFLRAIFPVSSGW